MTPRSLELGNQLFDLDDSPLTEAYPPLDRPQQFAKPQRGSPAYFGHPKYFQTIAAVVASQAFQRLSDIRFLGAIDYLVHPNGSAIARRHTRFDHSLGVARLARQFSRNCDLPEEDEKHIVVAALLHDVGHGPLSHSLEPVFKDEFGISHHATTESIVSGKASIGNALPSIFRDYNIDAEKLIGLIAGTPGILGVEAFSNPINIDTIEGISRAFKYMTPEATTAPPSHILSAMTNRKSKTDERTLDGFWEMKSTVYTHLINSRPGVIADYICREYMQDNKSHFSGNDYFLTETELRKKHPQLFQRLKELRKRPNSIPGGKTATIDYIRRDFFVDPVIPIGDVQSLYDRYLQTKTIAHLTIEGFSLYPSTSAK